MDKNTGHIRVPEGYFDGLKTRLSAIPASGVKENGRRIIRLVPYLTMAACMGAAVLVGNIILSRTANVNSVDDELEMYLASSLIPATEPYAIFDDSGDTYEVSVDDVAEYLIASGTTIDHLDYLINE